MSQTRIVLQLSSLVLFGASCSTIAPLADGGGVDANGTDAHLDAHADASDGTCTLEAVGKVCVRGTVDSASGEEALVAGGRVRFQVFPKGCHSSSCTVVREATCAVQNTNGSTVQLGARLCIEPVRAPACTPDCSGGGFANCEQTSVAAGSYRLVIDGLEVTFTVPSTLSAGGACAGSTF